MVGDFIDLKNDKGGAARLSWRTIASVTPEQVQAVAKKYLDPAHMVLVAVGAVDQSGKVVAPPP